MFSSSPSARQFLDALNALSAATMQTPPKALHNGVNRVLKAAEGYQGKTLDGLIDHIANPPKKPRKTKSAAAGSKLRLHSSELVKEIVTGLHETEHDKSAFEAYAQNTYKTCGAQTIKAVAANYAVAGQPGSKKAALDLILKARANAIRAEQKAKVSAKARPW